MPPGTEEFGARAIGTTPTDCLLIYVDDESNERMRGAAQGFIAFILWGVGAFVGTMLAGIVMAAHKLPTPIGKIEHDWAGIWIQPAIGAVAVLGVFLLFFREPGKVTTESSSDSLPPGEGTP